MPPMFGLAHSAAWAHSASPCGQRPRKQRPAWYGAGSRQGVPGTAVIALALLGLAWTSAGCRDEDAERIAELTSGESRSIEATTAPAQSQAENDAASSNRIRISLSGKAGFLEWTHAPESREARLRFVEEDNKPMVVEQPTLWLADDSGPQEVAVEPCAPAVAGCWHVQADSLAGALPRGVIRFESGGRRFRVPLPSRLLSTRNPGVIEPPRSLNLQETESSR